MIPSYMTQLEGVPDSSQAIPGMAFFAGTGPEGKTCGDCAHRGYRRQSQTGHWDDRLQQEVYRNYRHSGCAMFRALSGHHGPTIEAENRSCKYFEQKPPR